MCLPFSRDTLMSLVLQHHDVIAEIMSQNVTKEDIAGLAHRRKWFEPLSEASFR